MSDDTDYLIAKATAAQYVRETAKAQVLVDRFEGNPHGHLGGGTFDDAKARLAFCTAKAMDWGAKADALLWRGGAEDFG